MAKCYFCNGECNSTTITINNKFCFQSELFRANLCDECAEAVRSALVLLKTVTPKKDKESEKHYLTGVRKAVKANEQ